MVVIKPFLKKGGAGGACKWCAQGECWSHGQKGKGGGKSFGKGKSVGGGGGVVCHTCGKPGHKSPDCFQGAKGGGKGFGGKGFGGGGVVCHTCGKPGHKSPDCFQGAKGGGSKGFGAGVVCHNCGKPGHKSPDCFQGAKGKGGGKSFGGGVVCFTCGRPGHKTPDCFQGAKGFGKQSKGKGKGLRGFASEKKVWIGGLPADETGKDTNKALLEHMKQAGNCKWCEVGKSGQGGAAYATAEEATNAISMLDGSSYGDAVIQVDVWTKKEKE